MKRYGQLIGLQPERYHEYVKAHADVWPGVLAMIRECNIRNYSIFHRKGQLFAYFEYVGDDFKADMQQMADDPETQRWWNQMMPMQDPSPIVTKGSGGARWRRYSIRIEV
jgi:L-rhamnose mutarotase